MFKDKSFRFDVNKIIAYFLALCIILSCASMYSSLEILPVKETYFKLGVCIFCVIGIIWLRRVLTGAFLWTALLGTYYLAYLIFSDMSSEYVLYLVIPTLCLFFYIYTLNKELNLHILTDAFVNIMVIEAAVSIFCYIFGTLLNVLPGRIDITYYWAEASHECSTYFGLYFDNPVQIQPIFSHDIMRNTGIFTEAPGHSSMLTYALILAVLNLRKHPEKSKAPIIILPIAMVSTLSSKAFIILIIIAVCWYLTTIDNKDLVKYIIGAGIALIGLIIGWYIISDKSTTGSFSIRMDDIYAQLKAWSTNILFGVGYSNTDQIVKYFTVYRSNDGLSMGMCNVLARGGLYLFSIYVLSAVRYFRAEVSKGEMMEGIMVLAALGCEFFISTCSFTVPFMMLVCIGLCSGTESISNSVKQDNCG